jgi:DNA modification methylase
MKVKELSLDPANARTHSPVNLKAIQRSLTAYGQRKPIVVQERTDGGFTVRAGNGTLMAAKALGWDVLAAAVFNEPDMIATAYAIADNRTGETSDWDEDVLTPLLEAIEADVDLNLIDTGFSETDLAALLRDDEPLPEEEALEEGDVITRAKPGDLWLLGEHRLVCGDAGDPEVVKRAFGKHRPFMMVTDPPYGVEYNPEWRTETGINKVHQRVKTGTVSNDDCASWEPVWRLFPGDVAYVWHAGKYAGTVDADLKAVGIEVRTQIIWQKPQIVISRGHYHYRHEPCFYAVRKGKTSRWCGDRKQSTIWEINVRDEKEFTNHSTQKPLECMARPIRNHGKAGDVIYDPFLGSGTTLIAADGLGRVCVACELDPTYVDIILARWEKLTGGTAELSDNG